MLLRIDAVLANLVNAEQLDVDLRHHRQRGVGRCRADGGAGVRARADATAQARLQRGRLPVARPGLRLGLRSAVALLLTRECGASLRALRLGGVAARLRVAGAVDGVGGHQHQRAE